MMEFRTLIALLFLAHSVAGVLPQLHQVHSKFEYRHTFKGPHITNSKGIPFWEYGGSAIAGDESVRVCPSIKSRRGWVWSKGEFAADNWMIDITLRVSGRLKTGADGMAIWFTEQRGTEGSVYGNTELWKGLAVILDSFDNDIQHDNPRIQVVLNDGTKQYDHRTDGKSIESGACVIDYRNRPFPVKLRMTYLRGVFELWVQEGLGLTEDDYQLCVKLEEVPEMPKVGYLGVTAATGGLSDDHDITSFITHTLTPMETIAAQQEAKRFDQGKVDEMADQYSKMAQDFDDRRRENYTHHQEDDIDWKKEVEFEQSMRLVGDMQMALMREIRAITQRLDVIQGGAIASGGRDGGAIPSSLLSELAQIKNTEAAIQRSLGDLKATLDRGTPEGVKVTASEQLQPLYDTKALVAEQSVSINNVLEQLKLLSNAKCPAPAEISCLSPWLFVVVIATQLVVMLGYTIYMQAQERNAKKFF